MKSSKILNLALRHKYVALMILLLVMSSLNLSYLSYYWLTAALKTVSEFQFLLQLHPRLKIYPKTVTFSTRSSMMLLLQLFALQTNLVQVIHLMGHF